MGLCPTHPLSPRSGLVPPRGAQQPPADTRTTKYFWEPPGRAHIPSPGALVGFYIWDRDIGAVRGAVLWGWAIGRCWNPPRNLGWRNHPPVTGHFHFVLFPLFQLNSARAVGFVVKQCYSLRSPLGLQQNKRESAASPASPHPVFSLPVVRRLCPITDFPRNASCNRLKPCGSALRVRRRFCGLFS